MTKSSWVIYIPLIFPVSACCPICTVEHSRVKTHHPFRSVAMQLKSILTPRCLVGSGVCRRRGGILPTESGFREPPSSILRGQLSTNQGLLEGNERELSTGTPYPGLTSASSSPGLRPCSNRDSAAFPGGAGPPSTGPFLAIATSWALLRWQERQISV